MKNEKVGCGVGLGLYHNNTHLCTLYVRWYCTLITYVSKTLEQAASYFINKTCCRQRVFFFFFGYTIRIFLSI